MKIEMYHASKFGNGKKVASYLQGLLIAKGHQMNVLHVKETKPKALPPADLYIFCSPTRIGKPIGSMRSFLKKAKMPDDTKYALIATLVKPRPNKKTGEMPTKEEIEKWQRNLPIMERILKEKGMTKVADLEVYVLGIKGPLEEGWEKKVEEFASLLG